MECCDVQPHVKLSKNDIRPVVLVVGDPGRCVEIASMCKSSKEIVFNREYRTFLCNCHEDKAYEFLVVSHGIGSAGASLCFTELIHLGAKVIIRAGTCGSLQPTVRQGDIIVIHSAIREDGVTRLLVPDGFPAISCPMLFHEILDKAKDLNIDVVPGMTVTSDLFYPSKVKPGQLDMFRKTGCEAIEMEVAPLLVLGYLSKIQTAALCVVDGSPLEWAECNYDPDGHNTSVGKAKMLTLALGVVSDLAKHHNK